MFDLLTEVKKMKTMMGLIKEDQDLESINKHAQNILNILKFSGLYSSTIKKLIDKIIKFGETNIIDFDLIEKNLKNVMLKKGNRKKNVEDYFLRIFTSLEFREKGIYGIEPETDDFNLGIEDVSIVPKKIFNKELYGLQVELIKLQEWLAKTDKTVLIVFEGRPTEKISLQDAEEIMSKEINDLKNQLIDTAELQKWKNKAESTLVLSEMGIQSKSMNLGFFEALGNADLMNAESDIYQSLTAEEIQNAAQQWLRDDQKSVLTYKGK